VHRWVRKGAGGSRLMSVVGGLGDGRLPDSWASGCAKRMRPGGGAFEDGLYWTKKMACLVTGVFWHIVCFDYSEEFGRSRHQ
jgi:hypothetical protein